MKPVIAQPQAAKPCRLFLARLLRSSVLVLLALLVTLIVPVGPGHAQDRAQVQEQTIQDLEALVATLEDDAQRQELLNHLKALLRASRPDMQEPSVMASMGAQLLEDVSLAMGDASREMAELGRSAEDLPKLWDWLVERVADAETRAAAVRGTIQVAALIAAAVAAFFLVSRLLATPRMRLHGRHREPRWYERLFISLGLLLVRAAPVGALLAVATALCPPWTWRLCRA